MDQGFPTLPPGASRLVDLDFSSPRHVADIVPRWAVVKASQISTKPKGRNRPKARDKLRWNRQNHLDTTDNLPGENGKLEEEQEEKQKQQQQQQQQQQQTNWKDQGSFSSTTNSEQFKSNQCRLSQPFCQWLEPSSEYAWQCHGVRSGVGTVHVS